MEPDRPSPRVAVGWECFRTRRGIDPRETVRLGPREPLHIMDPTNFVYTVGMTDSEVTDVLERRTSGVLSFAVDDDAYAIPISYHYADGSVYFRFGNDRDEAGKVAAAETTGDACFVLYEEDDEDSWSVILSGPLRRVDDPAARGFDETTMRERFGPIRVFDEAVEEIRVELYELDARRTVGRRTTD